MVVRLARDELTGGRAVIRKFKLGRKLLHFPKKWANEIVTWLSGIHSPDGTIDVRNTLAPTGDGSLQLAVNLAVVYAEIVKRLDRRTLTKTDIEKFRLALFALIDGVSIVRKGEMFGVSAEWVKNLVADVLANGRGEDEEKGVDVSERVIYENIHSPSGTSHYYGTKVIVSVKNGLVTKWDVQGVYDLFSGDPA